MMTGIKAPNTLVLSYGDSLSLLLLWQKAFLLLPLWAIPLVPLVGLASRYMGSVAMDVGYSLLLCLFITYFLEDSLKRKIRIDDNNLFFGFRVVPIKDIISVEIPGNKSKLLPSCLAITSQSGGQLKLKLNGLSDRSIELLIAHLQSRNSAIKVSPVLNTLLKAGRAPQLPLVVPAQLRLSYDARPFIVESIAIFKHTAGKWMRFGPIVALLAMAPMWINWLSNLYFMFQPHEYGQAEQFAFHQFLTQCSAALGRVIYSIGSSTSTTLTAASHNPLVVGVLALWLAAMTFYMQRLLWKPNCLISDNNGLRLVMRMGALNIPFKKVQWSQVERLELQEGAQNAAKIHIERKDSKKLDLDLSAINVDERGLLLKRIETYVPDCQVGHQVTQSLMAKSDHSYTELWLQSLTQAPERKTLDPLEPGQMAADGRFEILRSLGVGGQGTAYLCRDTNNGESHSVVLKETILPVFVDPVVRRKALEGFEQEAKLLQSLNHPGVVQLVDYFVEDHRAYLVLEYLAGNYLRELVLQQGPLSELDRVIALARQMCTILTFLHDQGVIHRDFTPENLIVDSKDQLKLIDFNVAQQTLGGSQGTIVGKPAYMPPEQFRGKATTQSDIYAFGATLYYLLTGSDPDAISQSSPAAEMPTVSGSINEIVKICTALDLNKRYKSAAEILADLDSIADVDDIQIQSRQEVLNGG